ncbi:MAG: SMI1/KNR4 family protein [Lachnospiraceae bacterium]|nr:SMI1/KNR4 family protein [Lachnospiraceae bacterium]
MYETHDFLSDVILIGSDGGDMAYGIDINGRYIEVPFIGMDDEEIKVIGNNFDDFINYIWSKS